MDYEPTPRRLRQATAVVTGSQYNGTNNDYYTAKYAVANALLWEKVTTVRRTAMTTSLQWRRMARQRGGDGLFLRSRNRLGLTPALDDSRHADSANRWLHRIH